MGCTNEITLHNIIKEGTIMGPIFSIVETDKVDEMGERCYPTYGPEIRIKNLLYVGKIVGSGNPMAIEIKKRYSYI